MAKKVALPEEAITGLKQWFVLRVQATLGSVYKEYFTDGVAQEPPQTQPKKALPKKRVTENKTTTETRNG